MRPGPTDHGTAYDETVVPATRRTLRVPELTAGFWIAKGLSTVLGESASDYPVRMPTPVPAVGIGFVASLALQSSMRRCTAWSYWFAVLIVGVVGYLAVTRRDIQRPGRNRAESAQRTRPRARTCFA